MFPTPFSNLAFAGPLALSVTFHLLTRAVGTSKPLLAMCRQHAMKYQGPTLGSSTCTPLSHISILFLSPCVKRF